MVTSFHLQGKIIYKALERAFQIKYTDAAGQQHYSQKGLRVPTADIAGARLPPEEFDEHMVMVRLKALNLWNELDKYDAPRF